MKRHSTFSTNSCVIFLMLPLVAASCGGENGGDLFVGGKPKPDAGNTGATGGTSATGGASGGGARGGFSGTSAGGTGGQSGGGSAGDALDELYERFVLRETLEHERDGGMMRALGERPQDARLGAETLGTLDPGSDLLARAQRVDEG
jgi:hypothetical protein